MGVHGTGGGAYDPFLTRKTNYSAPKVDHTAEYVQMGTMMANMIGSIFIANAQAKASSSASAAGANNAQATQTQQTINAYVAADKEYDTAKQNMKLAVEDMKGLETELKNAEAAKKDNAEGTSQKKLDDYNAEVNKDAKLQAFTQLQTDFNNAKSEQAAYNKLNTETNKLQASLESHKGDKDLEQGFNYLNPESIKPATIKEGLNFHYDGCDTEVKFKGDGTDEATVSGKTFYGKDTKTNKQVELPQAKQAAMNQAKGLDKQFNARKEKADGLKETAESFSKNKLNLKEMENSFNGSYGKYNINIKSPQIQESSFTTTLKDGTKVSLSGNKNDKVGNTGQTYATSKTHADKLEAKVNENKEIGTDKNIESIKEKIAAKKKEIKGTLKNELTTKKAAYDIAKAAFNRIAADADGAKGAQDVANSFGEAAKKIGKHKKFLGLRIGKSTQANKDAKTAKRDAQSQQAAFQQNYGVDFSAISQQITMAQAKANAVNVDLKDADWQKYTT